MIIPTLIYGLILIACDPDFVKGSAMSSIREEGAPLLLYNPGHDLEGLDYGVKRDRDTDSAERGRRKEHPGASYIRVGRSHGDGAPGEQSFINDGDDLMAARANRGRSDVIIRLGRSSLKLPHHKIDQLSRGFVRIGKSGSSKWTRLGRSAASAAPSDAEMAVLCPNIFVADDPRASEDLQIYLTKLMDICNNNNNGIGDGNEGNSHRNNLEFLEANGDGV